MSQDIRYKYDQIKEGNTEMPNPARQVSYGEAYIRESSSRYVCFVVAEENKIFLNYSYLVTGEYMPSLGIITLTFTTHIISLSGVHLENLFYDFMMHMPRQVTFEDARYNAIDEEEAAIVNSIKITKVE